jgi:hypothetical protein
MPSSDTTTSFGDRGSSPRKEERKVLHAMLWIDWDFDYNDQLADKYMKFRGEYYDVGTICKIKGPYGPRLVRFTGWHFDNNRWNFELVNKEDYGLYDTYDRAGVNDYCLEIVVPVKPNLEKTETSSGGFGLPSRDAPPSWDVEIGWIWYIVIMAVGLIFKDRWLIWGFTTAVFFLWKGGFLNGGKK